MSNIQIMQFGSFNGSIVKKEKRKELPNLLEEIDPIGLLTYMNVESYKELIKLMKSSFWQVGVTVWK